MNWNRRSCLKKPIAIWIGKNSSNLLSIVHSSKIFQTRSKKLKGSLKMPTTTVRPILTEFTLCFQNSRTVSNVPSPKNHLMTSKKVSGRQPPRLTLYWMQQAKRWVEQQPANCSSYVFESSFATSSTMFLNEVTLIRTFLSISNGKNT